MKIGVLGVQGDVSEHIDAVNSAANYLGLDVDVVSFSSSDVIPGCDVVILPGGESTTISKLVRDEGIDEEIISHVEEDKPILATCAGLIILSSKGDLRDVENIDILDIKIRRNAYGSQRESFEAGVEISFLDDDFPGVFIRAPVIKESDTDVEVIGRLDGDIVGVRQRNIIGLSFHPELTGDYRIHREILKET